MRELPPTKWYPCLQRAAHSGNAIAQFHLGWCYKQGIGVILSLDQAVHWYGRAVNQGVGDARIHLINAQDQLATRYQTQKLFSHANELYRRAAYGYMQMAEQGNSWAQLKLSEYYRFGKGIRNNADLAAYWQAQSMRLVYVPVPIWRGA